MKKIFLLSALALVTTLIITSCVRTVNVNTNEDYWMSQERGDVVYSDSYCGYYVVETAYGYTIIRSISGYRPYEGAIVYGNFGTLGVRDFYNYSTGVVVRGEIVEYDLTYTDAQYAIDYYCPYGKANGYKIKESETAQSKAQRTTSVEKQ